MAERPILILSARHRPIETSFLIASLLLGVFGLIRPAATVRELDQVLGFGWLWYVGITVGALIGLSSLFLQMPSNLIWERIGLVTISTFFLGYSFAATTFFGLAGFHGSILIITFGIGALLRAWQITRDLRLLENATRRTKR